MVNKHVRILGCYGIPARHGGFETFAEALALYLSERGWTVEVYCQEPAHMPRRESMWQGIRLVHIPAKGKGPLATAWFDFIGMRHAARSRAPILLLGYNTAIFGLLAKLGRVPLVINMDGLEWKRQKWRWPLKAWLYANEWIAARLATHLIADHPAIAQHLRQRAMNAPITTIPYGALPVKWADAQILQTLNLQPNHYITVIARPEPENHILPIVRAFSRKRRGIRCVVLGNLSRHSAYHRAIREAASDEVTFLGGLYDADTLRSLRFHARCYVHGHSVGGTNPSLLEAMAAGNAVIAHDNAFNRWVLGSHGAYFASEEELANQFDTLLQDPARLRAYGEGARREHAERFTWGQCVAAYEQILLRLL